MKGKNYFICSRRGVVRLELELYQCSDANLPRKNRGGVVIKSYSFFNFGAG
jgi:hypothetical protein